MDIKKITDDFALFDDWEDRFQYLIGLGESLPAMPDALKTEENRVRGCMSQVWMTLAWRDGRLQIAADSDARIVRGLIAILITVFDGKTHDEARAANVEEVFSRLGLDQHLSPNRRNGFFSMVERARVFIEAGT